MIRKTFQPMRTKSFNHARLALFCALTLVAGCSRKPAVTVRAYIDVRVAPCHNAGHCEALKESREFCFHKGNLAHAEDLFQKTLALRRKLLGKEHPFLADSLVNFTDIPPETETFFALF
jgi:hypothetical protein